jgi:AcrR family transcriptional regulator
MARKEPPYQRIVAELRDRILAGELRPGERVPSIRQIAQRWGVAGATATRVIATLREEGLVEARVGSGTVVSARSTRGTRSARSTGSAGPRRKRPTDPAKEALSLNYLLRTAIGIADVEGFEAVSMRRLAAELDVGPMSLYRHVANKDELVMQMADDVFGEQALPDPGPAGWRAKLELVSRLQWTLCRRHLWLPRAVSFTRPLLAPNMMAHTEWTLRALDGLGLSMTTRMQEALALHSIVTTVALSVADEVEAEQETGVSLTRWLTTQQKRADELLGSGQFPLLAAIPPEVASDLDGLFEYSLARHLDGFAALVDAARIDRRDPGTGDP